MINGIRLNFLAVATAFSCAAWSNDAELSGAWYEANNYPASSVMRFERNGDQWVGRYIQVSTRQQMSGFAKGEAVIRGTLVGNVFKGEVLMKLSDTGLEDCPNFKPYWTPIEMKLIEPGKLYGAWLQQQYDPRQNCALSATRWQLYGLERLKLD